ncbi:MAG TPA: CRISPR-associated protein Cas5 [Bacteroidales bacterium]|nr:CRISPR-associated protein Cas5 [Bacteroidales bacterium]
MEVLVFDIKSSIAHFRRPDTTNTHATYPFIPYTTVRGLAGSIIGLPDFKGKAWVGIRLINAVKTSVQQMSMLGKGWLGGGSDINRPTAIELLVAPHYRIYWHGDYVDQLKKYIYSSCSHYHTYLGSAFALTFPEYVDCCHRSAVNISGQPISCSTIVPMVAIEKLIPVPGTQYGRVGGMHCEYYGGRKFGITTSVIYEPTGSDITLIPRKNNNSGNSYVFIDIGRGETVCLW